MEKLIDYIKPELLIVAVLLYGLGVLLKKSKLKDNFIPIILGVIGMLIAVAYCFIVEGVTFTAFGVGVVQGLLCAACSNYVNQILKQMQKLNVVNDKAIDKIEDAIDFINKKS